MALARSFRDLNVYKKAFEEADRIFRKTQTFPKDERFALSEQIRRSSSAVSAMIAEGWGKRRYPRAFKHILWLAVGEASETQAWLDHAQRRGYITEREHETMDDAWAHINSMLYRMINKADSFARPK